LAPSKGARERGGAIARSARAFTVLIDVHSAHIQGDKGMARVSGGGKVLKAISGETVGGGASGATMPAPGTAVSEEDRKGRIAAAAYFKAQARGFAPGRELEDWLEAEAELAQRETCH
jgi:hypothetical protein